MNLRKLHRKMAPILFVPLLLSAATGILYRLGRSWWGFSNEFAEWMMFIHQGEYLGRPLVPIYVLLVGLGLLGLTLSGLAMLNIKRQLAQRPATRNVRWTHHCLAVIVFLPLAISAVTGVAYRLGQSWFGFPRSWTALLLNVHQGSYWGPQLRVVYVLLVGLGLMAQLTTGIHLSGIFGRNVQRGKTQAKPPSNIE